MIRVPAPRLPDREICPFPDRQGRDLPQLMKAGGCLAAGKDDIQDRH